MSSPNLQPSPQLFFQTAQSYQRSFALKGAIDLGFFTAIGEGKETPYELAQRCAASERGMEILCDYMTSLGFLTKQGDRYRLTPDSAQFLDQSSRKYVGGALDFLLSAPALHAFHDVAATVRKGGTILPEAGALAPEHPIWETFARGMAPLMAFLAHSLTSFIEMPNDRKIKVLDLAAGHGMFGITLAHCHPNIEVVAQDWPNVLLVAQENATQAGIADRYHVLPGNAFEVDFGSDYDLVLMANFLHHFDRPTCITLLHKVYAALGENGRAITVEFVPNEDLISPPEAAGFRLIMLATTPAGDAYPFSELKRMLDSAGFQRSELHQIPLTAHHAVISHKQA